MNLHCRQSGDRKTRVLLQEMQCRYALSSVFRFRVICRTTIHTASILSLDFLIVSLIITAGNTYNHISRDFTIIISVCPFVKHIASVFLFLNRFFTVQNLNGVLTGGKIVLFLILC